MQGIFRQLASTGLTGLAIAGCALMAPAPALALSEQEILEKLESIPVFLIVNGDGQSLTASVGETEEEQVQVPLVFINSTEAENFLTAAAEEDSPIAEGAQLAVLPLNQVYSQASSQLDSPESLVYVPSVQSVQEASQIAQQEFQGVPLYAAVNLEEGQYLLTSDNTLPMFFSLADLQSQVSALIDTNPAIEEVIGVEVTTFEGILSNMAANDPDIDEFLELVQFVPSSQTLQYLDSLSTGAN
ncbi:Tic22 family protein [Halomicronema sp. CCY15110]|uniref:Tic22 family protein n=1 Tax=Halomicronema sp. CCY15110 TaxID=2767773 RepID=UPI00194ED43B|nr:Tic22 family protein [Halomicronema sp. CCY15110]